MILWRRQDAHRTANGLLLVLVALGIGFLVFMARNLFWMGVLLGFPVPQALNPMGPQFATVMLVSGCVLLAAESLELLGYGLCLSLPRTTGGRVLVLGAMLMVAPAVILQGVDAHDQLVQVGALPGPVVGLPHEEGLRLWLAVCTNFLFIVALKRLAEWLGEPAVARKAVRELLLMLALLALLMLMVELFKAGVPLGPDAFRIMLLAYFGLIIALVIRCGMLYARLRQSCLAIAPRCPEEIERIEHEE